jgi:intron-binding protein aquarius
LVTGELWPSQRKIGEDANEAVAGEVTMEGVEHLGQYVFEMTTTKIQQLQAEGGLPSSAEIQQVVDAQQKEIEPIPEEDEDGEDAAGAVDGSKQVVEAEETEQ